MDEPVSFFDNIWHGGLAFEYVAISDIKPGDEITVDYGPEWEEAWSNHTQHWQSPDGAETYVSPQELNGNHSIPIPTYDEDNILVGETIDALCHFPRRAVRDGRKLWQWQKKDIFGIKQVVQRIIDRTPLPSGQSYNYTVELRLTMYGMDSAVHIVENVPRKALSFSPKKYKSDMFMKGVFRHEMMIPDEIFPDAWKNIL